MRESELTISREKIGAAIFNLDGVVTRITDLHIGAWKDVFDAYLHERSCREGEDYRPFDVDHDYYRYFDGRPRSQAIKHFLIARHIDLPRGEPDDAPDRETIYGIGNRKLPIFDRIVEERGVEVYGCAIALIHRLRKAGIKTAVISASMHCDIILERAEIADLFDARVDGREAERLDLDSKPDPDTFLEAARRLNVEPSRTAVFEDTLVGITAGVRGRFGLVVGVDRGGQERKLRDQGAAYVLTDLCRVAVEGMDAGDGQASPVLVVKFESISNRLADKRPAIFLDYGGTLAPVADRPEDARLSDPMRALLGEVARVTTVVVVSGRSLDDVIDLVGLPEIIYAGSHGLEIQGPTLDLELPGGVGVLDELEKAAAELATLLEQVPGVRLERKRFTIVIHVRQLRGQDRSAVVAAIEQIEARYQRLHRTGGKDVIELLPDIDWDKGRAVAWLLSELGLEGPDVVPIYIGDDVTDEDAFKVVRGRGLGILVSDRPQPSAADYRLKDTAEVAALLRHLLETLRKG